MREVQKSLGQSVKRLLEDKIKRMGVESSFRILNTHIETPYDGIIIFEGMQSQTEESIKSLEGFNRAWFEEAQTMSQRSLNLLRPTIRAEDAELWFGWNPDKPTDPVDRFFRGGKPPPNSVCVEVNFSDNPWFPKKLEEDRLWDLENNLDEYANIWGGKYRKIAGSRVFKNWKVVAFKTPRLAQFQHGADWGFAVDPTVLVRGFVVDRTLYIDREVHAVGVEVDDTPALFDQLDPANESCARKWVITADSSRPETISYMRRHGYPRIQHARKGPGSVEEGIKFLQRYNIIVHPRCVHTIAELSEYGYKLDRLTQLPTPVLQDKKNHVIDSLRYMAEDIRKPRAGVY